MPASKSKSELNTGFNLTKAVVYGRVALKFSIASILFLMIGRFVLNTAIDIYRALNPPPPPPPTVGFGVLPTLQFSAVDTPIPKQYQLETASGGLPIFPDRAKVFFMPKSQQSLLSLDEAKTTAARLGFRTEPEALDVQTYRWKSPGQINQTLELNIVTNNFDYFTDYLIRPEFQADGELPSTFDAVSTVKSFFIGAALLPEDVATSSGETRYLKLLGGAVKEAVSLSDAQIIEVRLPRTSIDDTFPPITAQGLSSQLEAKVAMINGKPEVFEASRQYFPINYDLVETYPIKTANEAWRLLQAGEGHIASGVENEAVIRSVQLGYFESDRYQSFFQPVYIFRGDNGFIGLVPAVSSSFLQQDVDLE